jgi:hypothetical protein
VDAPLFEAVGTLNFSTAGSSVIIDMDQIPLAEVLGGAALPARLEDVIRARTVSGLPLAGEVADRLFSDPDFSVRLEEGPAGAVDLIFEE